MKHYTKLFFAAAIVSLGLASCAKEVAQVETPKDNLVTVHFGATAGIEGATKATLTPDESETLFTSAWENGDKIFIQYENGATTATTTTGTWNGTKFEATMPSYTGMWEYTACYPTPPANAEISFGANRTQKGNLYNSNYDVMIAPKISCDTADAGKDDNGNDVVFNMERQTAIAYFHLRSELNEDVISAELFVEGGNIASSYALLSPSGFTCEEDLKKITITFEDGTAPKASDFQLWFNVLPTTYTKTTLTVETTNHTLTISRTATAESKYEAGKLYKVSKSIPAEKWTPKAAYTGDELVFNFKTVQPEGWPDSKDNAKAGTYKYAVNGVDYSFILGDGVYCAGKTPASAYLMITKSSSLGLPAIAGYKLTKVIGTLNDTGLPSTKAKICITDGANVVSGGTAQEWNTQGKDYTYTLSETEENTVYYLSVSSVANCQMTKLVLSYEPATHRTALETPANLQVSAAKVVSWDAVNGAASYEITIGKDTFTSETNSYDAAAVVDDYYDVAVVAVPSDKENYKNSIAATLSGAKFGTPKLTTPELTEGAIDETSIRVNMTVDARATNGCTCEIYKGETLVESKTITESYVVFDGLEDGVTYTIKVNAIAVEGEKPYAASDVASIELSTKAAQHVSDVTKAGTYTIKGLTVYAVPNTSNAIVGDGTGFILLYKRTHGLTVGDTFNVAGTVKKYNGVWEFDNPSIIEKAAGEAPVYPEAIEADEAYLTSYGTATKIEYIHAKGTQSGKDIKVGTKTLYLSADKAETDGKNVEVTGFVYGYNSESKRASFVATSIQLDSSAPYLSVDQTSKVWAADATDAFVVKVTVNSEGGDWNVTPTALDWATVSVDKAAGTITVTPNGANTAETANEATLTVAHASDASLTKKITLKQNAAGVAALTEKTATIKFGTNDVKINKASVTANDDQQNSWTIATTGKEVYFATLAGYAQVGSAKKPATSITFTTTLPNDAEVVSISAKFGGFGDTTGDITLKVGETSIGTGKLDAKNDVTVTSTHVAVGNKVSITVTNIAKGVKCYNIQVKYKTAN